MTYTGFLEPSGYTGTQDAVGCAKDIAYGRLRDAPIFADLISYLNDRDISMYTKDGGRWYFRSKGRHMLSIDDMEGLMPLQMGIYDLVREIGYVSDADINELGLYSEFNVTYGSLEGTVFFEDLKANMKWVYGKR